MKKYLIITSILFFSLMLTTSCDDYLDVNTDPNNPTSVTPELILPVGQNYTANYVLSDRRLNHLGNMMMYNWSEAFGFSWYDDEFRYKVTSTFYDNLFDDAYLNALKQYQILSEMTEDHPYYAAIGSIMKAYHFQILVDLYGDIPYSEALGRGDNATPAYDDAETIYKDLMVQLTNAVNLINTTEQDPTIKTPGNDDFMFNGDMLKWKQFANSLKIRLMNRAKSSFDIAAELSVIDAEGSGYITEDVAINPPYQNEEDKQNPYWRDFGWDVGGTARLTNNATCATQYDIDYLTSTNDPRIDFIYERPESGIHLGVEQGVEATSDHAAVDVSNIGPGILKGSEDHADPDLDVGSSMPGIIFTVAETDFNLAELALAGNNVGGTAESFYNDGVQASFNTLGAGDASVYLSQNVPNISYSASSGNELEAIITQKWIAMNGITAEQSWFDYSRTGFPAGLPVSALASTPDRPVRLYYPSSEVTGNSVNMPTQPNAFTAKIFWAN